MDLAALDELLVQLPDLIFWMAIGFLFLSLLIVGFIAAGYFFFEFFRWGKREDQALEVVLLQVAVPRANEIKIDAMEQFFSSLYTLYRGKSNWFDFMFLKTQEHIAFEIVALPGDIRF